MTQIAFIGTGVMGAPMAGHLVQQGHQVKAYNRHPAKAQAAAERYGFEAVERLHDCLQDATVVFTMLGFPEEVEALYFGEQGLLESVQEGSLLIDLTTSSPRLALKIFVHGQRRQLQIIDAPVSGGDRGAQLGELVVMCGGEDEDFAKALPYLQSFAKDVKLMGPAGFGQHCKACNQIAVAGATAAYTEALAYAQVMGLDPQAVLDLIQGGAAGSWQLAHMAPRSLAGDLGPGFYIKHFLKDMGIAVQAAQAKGLDLNITEKVLDLYQAMAAQGQGDLGTQALLSYYASRLPSPAPSKDAKGS